MKLLHKIKRFTLILMSIVLLFIIGTISWYKFSWPRYVNREQIIEFTSEINNTDSLPNSFYDIYDRLYPNQRHTTIMRMFIVGGFRTPVSDLKREYISPTKYVSRFAADKGISNSRLVNFHSSNHIYYAFAIDKYTTPEKCFDYYLHHFNFLYNWIGIDAASNGYFEKNIEDLTQDEIIGLISILTNPVQYNPRRNPERHKREVDRLKERL